jgi:hypothetical protein
MTSNLAFLRTCGIPATGAGCGYKHTRLRLKGERCLATKGQPKTWRNRGDRMREIKKLDFTKLLGFETVSEQVSEALDFQDETISAKLGAKVGIDIEEPANRRTMAAPD